MLEEADLNYHGVSATQLSDCKFAIVLYGLTEYGFVLLSVEGDWETYVEAA